MNLTTAQLKRIIKEEISRVLQEAEHEDKVSHKEFLATIKKGATEADVKKAVAAHAEKHEMDKASHKEFLATIKKGATEADVRKAVDAHAKKHGMTKRAKDNLLASAMTRVKKEINETGDYGAKIRELEAKQAKEGLTPQEQQYLQHLRTMMSNLNEGMFKRFVSSVAKIGMSKKGKELFDEIVELQEAGVNKKATEDEKAKVIRRLEDIKVSLVPLGIAAAVSAKEKKKPGENEFTESDVARLKSLADGALGTLKKA